MRHSGINMSIAVKQFTVPAAGVDDVDITIEETYDVEGLGSDTVLLKGRLVSERTVPLLDHGTTDDSWDRSTVVAKFTKLELYGESAVFGPVTVRLDDSVPAFGVVRAGKCVAAVPLEVSMPRHGLLLRSEEPMQLQSNVSTVPPIGDEKTVSVKPIRLVDARTERVMGRLSSARVAWRDLKTQSLSLLKDKNAVGRFTPATAGSADGRLNQIMERMMDLITEVQELKKALGR